VRLHAAEEFADTNALLLERCRPSTPLAALPEPEQDEVIAGLLRRLWVAPTAGHPFQSLRALCEQWSRVRGPGCGRPWRVRSRSGTGGHRAVPGAAGQRGPRGATDHRRARRQCVCRPAGIVPTYRFQAPPRRPDVLTRSSTCSTVPNGCAPTPRAWPGGWPTCSDSISPAAEMAVLALRAGVPRRAAAGGDRPPDPHRLSGPAPRAAFWSSNQMMT
jgi:hypothetical protein